MEKCNGLMLAVVALVGVSAFAAPQPGSCEEAAIEIKNPSAGQTFAVSLTPSYNSETQSYDATNLVCFYKVTLSRGKAYSLWLTGADGWRPDVGTVGFEDVYPRAAVTDGEFEPGAMFLEHSGKWKPGSMMVLTEDEWWIEYLDDGKTIDEEMSDPKSWAYFIQLSGANATASVKLHYAPENALPIGIEDHPAPIVPVLVERNTGIRTFVDGEFSFAHSVDFIEGRRYLFASCGGTDVNPYSVSFGNAGKATPYAPWAEGGNDSWSFDPSSGGVGTVTVSETNQDAAATFALKYAMLPVRTLREHDPVPLALGEASASFVPGHVNATSNAYYDVIIDQKLFQCELQKGTAYVAETAGSKTNLLMRIYDGSGNIRYESTVKGDGTHDVRCGFTASYSGLHYVGVCQGLADDDEDEPAADNWVRLTVEEVVTRPGVPDGWDDADDDTEGAVPLSPGRGVLGGNPLDFDAAGSAGWHRLGKTDWYDTFSIVGRKGYSYSFKVSCGTNAAPTEVRLAAQVFYLNGKTRRTVSYFGDINPGASDPLVFQAEENAVYYVRVNTSPGYGLDYPGYKVHSSVYETESGSSDDIGLLKVEAKGCESATWTLGAEKARYPYGATVALPAASYRVTFGTVSGFLANPVSETVSVLASDEPVTAATVYSDKFDHGDDSAAGAVSWSLKSSFTSQQRTLWTDDPADWFKFSAKDGYYYNFAFAGKTAGGDAVMSLYDANQGVVRELAGVSAIEKVGLGKGTYFLKVAHANDGARADDAYVLAGKFANVGVIKFAKTAISVKDTATSVALTVNRTAKDGMVRVKYRTVEGTAKANEQFVPQEGVLEWGDGDKAAKTVTVKLIPKLLAVKTGDFKFKVELEDDGGEYAAAIEADACAVTIQNSGKYDSAAAAYAAANKTKPATTTDETVSLRAGTYYGVVRTLQTTNGFPALASVTLTVGAKEAGDPSKDTISAKVMLAGKTYAFKTAKGEPAWDEGEPGAGGVFKKKLVLMQKLGSSVVSNVLSVTVHDGVPGDWTQAVKEDVSLTMHVPDAKGKGSQSNVQYAGSIFRQNAKIQDYLDAVTNFCGYYTVALVPGDAVLTSGAEPDEGSGLPSGSGYLTVTVDNKGKAKVAGLLADGTKVSASPAACGIVVDGRSAVLGYSMHVPVYLAKSPYCFGGWLKLTARADSGRPDGRNYKVVIDGLESELLWNNDNAALTHDGKEGWRMAIQPVGGWYDKVFNLQAYYNDWAQQFSIDSIRAEGFPKEILASGYRIVTAAQPDDEDVNLAGDKFETAKKTLVKRTDNKKLNDWSASVNPCNVQVKLARATGVVTGSCSVWSETDDGSAQKEITGFKHAGVITLDRDDGAEDSLDGDVISAGSLNMSVKIERRKWAFSVPFNIKGEPLAIQRSE